MGEGAPFCLLFAGAQLPWPATGSSACSAQTQSCSKGVGFDTFESHSTSVWKSSRPLLGVISFVLTISLEGILWFFPSKSLLHESLTDMSLLTNSGVLDFSSLAP